MADEMHLSGSVQRKTLSAAVEEKSRRSSFTAGRAH